MTYPPPQQPPPVMPGYGYSPTPPNNDWAPPPAKRSALPWIIGGLLLAVVVSVGLVAIFAAGGEKKAVAPTAAPAAAGAQVTTDSTPDSAYTPYKPKPTDFKLTPSITRKKCFGSAGCNITFRVDAEYVGKFPLEDDWTWVVVYEINGVEDAPEVGSFELTGTRMTIRDEDVSTVSPRSKITLKVASVEQG